MLVHPSASVASEEATPPRLALRQGREKPGEHDLGAVGLGLGLGLRLGLGLGFVVRVGLRVSG